ncbi:MAG: hypothetical protein AB7V48_05180 [Sedimentibacter sp.]
MLNLIKYEFMKKYKLITLTLIISAVLNLYLIANGPEGSALFLILFPIVISVFYIVDILKMYSDDLNKKAGYMLFMTPNSGYKIIVSKILTAVIEGLSILFLYFIFILINGAYLIYTVGDTIDFNEIINVINSLLSGNFGFNLMHLFMIMLTGLLILISFLTTAYTAMTIRKSIFSEIKFGGALSFIIFILLNWAISYVSSEVFNILTPYYDSFTMSQPTATELIYIMLPVNIWSIAQSTILTLCSGYLLENKINL